VPWLYTTDSEVLESNQKVKNKAVKKELADELVARLRAYRARTGLTQEAFAEKSDITYKYYQALEGGRKRDLRLSTLVRLARAHGMEVWQLLGPNSPLAVVREEVIASKLPAKARRVGKTSYLPPKKKKK
jgi:transcriptional regulator with XRE-family HTH domain